MLHSVSLVFFLLALNALAVTFGIRRANRAKIKIHGKIGGSLVLAGGVSVILWGHGNTANPGMLFAVIDLMLMVGLCLNVIGLAVIFSDKLTPRLLLKLELGYIALSVVAGGLALGHVGIDSLHNQAERLQNHAKFSLDGARRFVDALRHKCESAGTCVALNRATIELDTAERTVFDRESAPKQIPFDNYRQLLETEPSATKFTPWNPINDYFYINKAIALGGALREWFAVLLGIALSLRLVKTVDELWLHPRPEARLPSASGPSN